MRISFQGSRLKIKRAYTHIDDLEAWVRVATQFNVNSTLAYKERNLGAANHMPHFQRSIEAFEDIPLIIGDAVHNLRASLDLVASAIVIAGGKDDPTSCYFPLQSTRQALIGCKDYGFIERVAPDLALIIADIIKPYKNGGDARFFALNQLDKMDKHRVLIPSIVRHDCSVVAIREDQEENPPICAPGSIYMLLGITSEDGSVVSVAREPRPGTKAYLHNQRNGYSPIDIMFGKGEAFENQAIIPTLRELAQLVSGVVDALEAHCKGG